MSRMAAKHLNAKLAAEGFPNVKLAYSPEDEEWSVNFLGGREGTRYYTEDWKDAFDTAKAMSKGREPQS